MMNKKKLKVEGATRSMDAIEHRLATKIKGIFHVRQMCLKGKEYLIKYKGCHHNKIV
jgi:hypothetical protein